MGVSPQPSMGSGGGGGGGGGMLHWEIFKFHIVQFVDI